MTWWGFLVAIAGVVAQAAMAAGIATNGGNTADVGSQFIGCLFFVAILWAIVYSIARAKNRLVSVWLGATFVLGPAPLLFLIFLPRQKVRDGETKLCPHCQSEIPIAATVCRYCSRDVSV